MKRLFYLISFLSLGVMSCSESLSDEEVFFRRMVEELESTIEITLDEDDIPGSPWQEVNPLAVMYTTVPVRLIFVENSYGEDLLDPETPGNLSSGMNISSLSSRSSPICIWSLKRLVDDRYYIRVQGFYPLSFVIHWADGTSDYLICHKEYNRDETMYRCYYLLNGKGEKMYPCLDPDIQKHAFGGILYLTK